MGANTGNLEAQRVLRLRNADADRIAQLERDERILRTDPVCFFEAVAKVVGENSTSFNSDLGLVGDYALSFLSINGQIQLCKKASPLFLRKAIHFQTSQEVLVRTETINSYRNSYRHGVKEEKWRFTVEQGVLLLNGRNVLECADALFDGIAEACR
jgi:hypothetical protein